MYSGGSGQDWEVVKFTKSKNNTTPIKEKVVKSAKNSQVVVDHRALNEMSKKIEKEDEVFHVERVTPFLRNSIIKARTAAKLTQAELAHKICQPTKVVQEYENGKATPNNQIIQKMSRVLGVTLKLREN